MLLNWGVGEDSWECLGLKIKPVHPKGNQSWMFIGRTDAEAETDSLATWCEEQTLGKEPDAEKDWRWEEKGMTEDEMVGWHHWLNGHAFEQPLGVSNGWGILACCSPLGCKELDMTEWLNWSVTQCVLCTRHCAQSIDPFRYAWSMGVLLLETSVTGILKGDF